jgi:hypothetical protein
MRCKQWALLWTLAAGLVCALGGCGGSDSGDSGEDSEARTIDPNGPDGAVAVFLEAVRKGDDQAASGMFTSVARERADQMGLNVAPQGSDTAEFQVGEVTLRGEAAAHVESTWSDLVAEGERRTDEITWNLRRETEGWRISGMSTTVLTGEPPLELDFENPEETLRRLNELKEKIRRQADAQRLQASRPENSADTFQR